MFDHRPYADSTLEGNERQRRPILGHEHKRVYCLPAERPSNRSKDRR